MATHPTHGNTEAQRPWLSRSPEPGLEALRTGGGGRKPPGLDLGVLQLCVAGPPPGVASKLDGAPSEFRPVA